jgi:hypothetical protein
MPIKAVGTKTAGRNSEIDVSRATLLMRGLPCPRFFWVALHRTHALLEWTRRGFCSGRKDNNARFHLSFSGKACSAARIISPSLPLLPEALISSRRVSHSSGNRLFSCACRPALRLHPVAWHVQNRWFPGLLLTRQAQSRSSLSQS